MEDSAMISPIIALVAATTVAVAQKQDPPPGLALVVTAGSGLSYNHLVSMSLKDSDRLFRRRTAVKREPNSIRFDDISATHVGTRITATSVEAVNASNLYIVEINEKPSFTRHAIRGLRNIAPNGSIGKARVNAYWVDIVLNYRLWYAPPTDFRERNPTILISQSSFSIQATNFTHEDGSDIGSLELWDHLVQRREPFGWDPLEGKVVQLRDIAPDELAVNRAESFLFDIFYADLADDYFKHRGFLRDPNNRTQTIVMLVLSGLIESRPNVPLIVRQLRIVENFEEGPQSLLPKIRVNASRGLVKSMSFLVNNTLPVAISGTISHTWSRSSDAANPFEPVTFTMRPMESKTLTFKTRAGVKVSTADLARSVPEFRVDEFAMSVEPNGEPLIIYSSQRN